MKKLNKFFIVLKKELRDAFRDKKSIIATLIIPLILFPLLFWVMGMGIADMTEKAQKPVITLADSATGEVLTLEDERFQTFKVDILLDSSEITYKQVEGDVKEALRKGETSLVVYLPSDLKADVMKDITLLYDDAGTSGPGAMNTIGAYIDAYYAQVAENKIKEGMGGVGYEDLKGITLVPQTLREITPVEEQLGVNNTFLQMVVPMLITLLLSIGGLSVAIDLVAGEKERNTFEPLLATSANRLSILSAKYSVIIMFSFLSAIAQLVGMGIAMVSNPTILGGGTSGTFNIPFPAIILAFFNLLMLAAIFSSVLLVLSSTAKSYKEASTKCSFVIFIPMIATYATMFTGAVDIGITNMLIPILNVISVIKMMMGGRIDYLYFTLALAANAVFVAVSVWYTLRSFNREDLITRG